VNIVRKHDFSGVELRYTYENTFDTDAPIRKLSLTVGENLEGGKTNLVFTASEQTEKPLLLQDRLSQIVGPYQSRYFSGYPGGARAYIGLTNGSGAFTTASFGYLSQPIITSANGTPLIAGNSATTLQVPAGYQGGQGLAPLQANLGNFNLSHPNTESFVGINGLRTGLNQGPTEKAFDLSLRRQMTSWLEVYAKFGNSSDESIVFNDRFSFSGITVPATAPGNPFGQAVTVSGVESSNLSLPESDIVTRTASVGAKIELPGNWKADLDYTWGSTNYKNDIEALDSTPLQQAVTNGTVNLIADLGSYPVSASAYLEFIAYDFKTSLDVLQLKAAGPLMKLWAGTPSLALGVEHEKSGNSDGYLYETFPG